MEEDDLDYILEDYEKEMYGIEERKKDSKYNVEDKSVYEVVKEQAILWSLTVGITYSVYLVDKLFND